MGIRSAREYLSLARRSEQRTQQGLVRIVDSSGGSQTGTAQVGFRLPSTLTNALSGAGGSGDKDAARVLVPLFIQRAYAEVLYRQSWAAYKMISIPVEDMWVRGRQWTGDDEESVKKMVEAERDLGMHKALEKAMIAGRLHGSAGVIVFQKAVDPSEPLDPKTVRPGDISNLLVVDRWDLNIDTWGIDPRMPGYGMPYMYEYFPRFASDGEVKVHHTRLIRFDGVEAPTTEGWTTSVGYRDWGVSELTRAVEEIFRETAIHAGIGHLVQESSIFMLKVAHLREALSGQNVTADTPDIHAIGESINLNKSLYRTLFIDRADEADRVTTAFSGIPELMDKSAGRLAAIADIPQTRFLGRSPAGMNATGESDMANYAIRVGAMQKRLLSDPLYRLDAVLASHAGISGDAPEYEWLPLMEMSPKDQAEAFKAFTEGVVAAYKDGLIDEDEARDRLSNNEMWGQLGPWSGPNAAMEAKAELERAKIEKQGQAGNGPPRPAAS